MAMTKRRRDGGEGDPERKKVPKVANDEISTLELMRMLRTASTPTASKLERVFMFIEGQKGLKSVEMGAVPMSHFISFLAEWIQPTIISSAKKNEDLVLDSKPWFILNWCLSKQDRLHVYPGILKGLEMVLTKTMDKSSYEELLQVILGILEILRDKYQRTFRPQLLDWTSLISSCTEALLKNETLIYQGKSSVFNVLTLAAELYAEFLTTHANPKAAFQVAVEKILFPMLILLGKIPSKHNMLSDEENVLYERLRIAAWRTLENGLFHTVHLDGFSEVCVTAAKWFANSEDLNEATHASNHKLLFEKIKEIREEKCMPALKTIGELFRVFIRRFKSYRASINEDIFGVRGTLHEETEAMENKTEMKGEVKKGLTESQHYFLVLGELTLPLIEEIRTAGCAQEIIFAVNELFRAVRDERIYIPTRDTPSRGHFKFIKLYYSVLIDYAKSESSNKDALMEIIRGLSCLMDIEHRAAEDHIQDFWNVLVAVMECAGNKEEVVNIGCQVLRTLSELRNLGSLTMLFTSIKSLNSNGLPHHDAIKSFICDPLFLKAIEKAVESLPEAQVPEFINLVSQDALHTINLLNSKFEVIIIAMGEVYTRIMENIKATSTNASQVGMNVRKLVDTVISEPLRNLLDKQLKKKSWKEDTVLRAYFLLQTYLSSRTLHRQCVSLMPPQKASKANSATHEFQIDGLEFDSSLNTDSSIFSWIGSSARVTFVIEKLSYGLNNPALQYVLDTLTLHRLNDLRSYILSAEYFEEKIVSQLDYEDPVMQEGTELQDGKSMAYKVVVGFKKEAEDLTHILLDGGEYSIRQMLTDGRPCNITWNEVLATLNNDNMYVARWLLISRSIDLWSSYARRKTLKIFINVAFDTWQPRNIPYGLSLSTLTHELLNNMLFYENQKIQSGLLPAAWKILSKLLPLNIKFKQFKMLAETTSWINEDLVSTGFQAVPLINLYESINLFELVSSFSWSQKSEQTTMQYIVCVCYIERFLLNVLTSVNVKETEYVIKLLELFTMCRRILHSISSQAYSKPDINVWTWLYKSIAIASERMEVIVNGKEFIFIHTERACMAAVVKCTQGFIQRQFSSYQDSLNTDDKMIAKLLDFGSGHAKKMTILTEPKPNEVYIILGTVSMTRIFLWTLVGYIETLDRKCQVDRGQKWSPVLPRAWRSFLRETEPIIGSMLLGMMFDPDMTWNRTLDMFLEGQETRENGNIEEVKNEEDAHYEESCEEDEYEEEKEDIVQEEGHHFYALNALQKATVHRIFDEDIPREYSEAVGEMFLSMAAVIKLRSLYFSPYALKDSNKASVSSSVSILLGVLHTVFTQAKVSLTEKGKNIFWLYGAIKCMESAGLLLPMEPLLADSEYSKLLNMHIDLLGAFTSAKHSESSHFRAFGDLKLDNGRIYTDLRGALTESFGALIRYAPRRHLMLALQTVHRAISGYLGESYLRLGDCDDGTVDVNIAAGVECLTVSLDAVSGPWRLKALGKFSSKLIAGLLNLVSHLQGPAVFFNSKLFREAKTESFYVLLQVLEVLQRVASREAIFPMKASHVAVALHCPAGILKPVYDSQSSLINEDLVLSLYTASCKLLCALLRHRGRESGRSIALLGESLRVMLYCLESYSNKNALKIIHLNTAVQCAQWLRRVYEELGEHKETLGRYCIHVLSDYLSVLSGTGLFGVGLDREIDKELRPGAFALLSSSQDLQQLHSALGEGAMRNNLIMIRQEYNKYYKYSGKV